MAAMRTKSRSAAPSSSCASSLQARALCPSSRRGSSRAASRCTSCVCGASRSRSRSSRSWAKIRPQGDMGRILTIAHLTFIEAYRRKIVPAALLCSVLFLLVYGTALYFINRNIPASPQRQFQLQFFVLAGLYVANFLAIASAVLLPVDTLSGEIDSGVMQTLASKPIRRAQIVLGKWAGHLLLALAYLLLLCAGILLVIRVVAGLAPAGAAIALPLLML